MAVQRRRQCYHGYLQTEHVGRVVADLLQQTVAARLPVQGRRWTLAEVVIVHAQSCQNTQHDSLVSESLQIGPNALSAAFALLIISFVVANGFVQFCKDLQYNTS